MTATTANLQETTLFALDPAHSSVEFAVRHLMISKVRGRFTTFEGHLELAPESDVPASVSAIVQAASIDTREEQRDAHLRSADFFDVETYPTLSFKSDRVTGTPDDFEVHGALTIRGITREVALKGQFEGRVVDPWGGLRVGYSAHAKINRKDFGLTWNAALETGGVVVGDEIAIELNVEAVRS